MSTRTRASRRHRPPRQRPLSARPPAGSHCRPSWPRLPSARRRPSPGRRLTSAPPWTAPCRRPPGRCAGPNGRDGESVDGGHPAARYPGSAPGLQDARQRALPATPTRTPRYRYWTRALPRRTCHGPSRHGHEPCRGTRHPRRRRAPAPPGARFRRSGGPFPAQRRGAPAAAALRPAHAARLRRRAGEHWSGRLWWLLPMLPVLQLPPKPTGRIPPGQDERTGSCRLRSLRARTMRPNGDRQGRYSWHGLRRAAAVVGGGGRQVRTVAGRERPQAWGWPGLKRAWAGRQPATLDDRVRECRNRAEARGPNGGAIHGPGWQPAGVAPPKLSARSPRC